MVAEHPKHGLGVCGDRPAAEAALETLKAAGFSLDQVSIIAREPQNSLGAAETSDPPEAHQQGAAIGALTGATLGSFGGLLVGLGTLAVPGVGLVFAAGSLATALTTTFIGGGAGLISGGLVGGFSALGLPEEKAKLYSESVAQGEYVIAVHGTEAELTQAETLLQDQAVQDWSVSDPPKGSSD